MWSIAFKIAAVPHRSHPKMPRSGSFGRLAHQISSWREFRASLRMQGKIARKDCKEGFLEKLKKKLQT